MPDYVNTFITPSYIEEIITKKETGKVVGTIRIKPSGLLWKPAGARSYYSVSLDTFTTWITSSATAAAKVKS
ncbi:hypothetical protein M2103_001999 [Ereboglobus sp. PH5-5]|uniref:hypothetical protein n=1 Tax=Ereboglobus sp. PH5-5 TaxID=2940529 RepID=UPI002406C179|nr:hypothetical protein [Ereboglobus sp. PH5-5]MDF9833766.1 hypothetical protein [Ereboglobus sp. PH5-5]